MNEPQHETENRVSVGDPKVDGAVSCLRDLEKRDVDEHAAVYERAHEALRQALDDDSQPSASTPPDAQ